MAEKREVFASCRLGAARNWLGRDQREVPIVTSRRRNAHKVGMIAARVRGSGRGSSCATPVVRSNRFGSQSRAGRQSGSGRGAQLTIQWRNGTNQKTPCKTIACSESWITVACYLCNTLQKTVTPKPIQSDN